MRASQPNEVTGDLSDIKRKLIWRMGIAGLMIVGLLGGLALFDYMSTNVESEPAATHYAQPVPVAKKAVTQPVTPLEPVPEAKEERKEIAPEATSSPFDKSAPRVEMPPGPQVSAHPTLPKSNASAPRVSPPVTAPVAPAVPAGRTTEPRGISVATPPQRGNVDSSPAPSVSARLFSGFALQAGVFSDPRRAEELHARLTLEGIPATIESRVQVGPFKNREEAEAARSRLKSLGVDAVMLLPAKGTKR